MTNALYGLGRACTRHRYVVLGAWAVLLIGLAVGAGQAGSLTNNNLSLPGTDSQKAQDLLAENFPKQANGTNPIVLAAPDGKKLTDDTYQQPIADAVSALQKTEHVITVVSPLSSQGAAQLSTKDPAIGYISVALDVGPGDITEDEANDIIDAAKGPTAKAGLQVAAGGYLGTAVSKPSTESSDIIGLSVAVVVLLLAFGSVVAMGLPIITAVLGLICGLSVITLLSHVADIPTTAPTVATMIGLAVGIDYSLFIVTKHRTQVAAGMEVDESIARAVATAGGAVVFAGGTVALSLLALAVADIPLVTALGWTAAIAVVFAILAALTLLPALFALLGDRVMALQLPFAKHHDQEHEATFWRGLATWITRHPWPVIVLVLALLCTLAIPTLSLRLGQPDAGSLPTDTNARQANDLIKKGFVPGLNGPFLISATFTDAGRVRGHAPDGPPDVAVEGRRRRVGLPADRELRGDRRRLHPDSDDGPVGPRHRGSRLHPARRHDPGGDEGQGRDRRRRRQHRGLRRPRRRDHREARPRHPDRRRAELPRAAARVPLAAARRPGRRDEPRLGRAPPMAC